MDYNQTIALLSEQIANLTNLIAQQNEAIDEQMEQTNTGIDNFYFIWAAVLVLMMHSGFAMLESGFVRGKNSINIFLKNLVSPVLAALVWYLWGYGFATGTPGGNSFIGSRAGNFALSDVHYRSTDMPFSAWFYGWTFSANAASIASGSCAERTLLGAYMIYIVAMVGWVYPVVAYWVFSTTGWLSATGGPNGDCCFISSVGFIDLAGSGVIHMLGGTGALMGAIALGPRLGRFDDKAPKPRGHSLVLSGLGALLLWIGWFGFNVGSTKSATGIGGDLGAVVAVNTTLAGITGALSALTIQFALDRAFAIDAAINGLLSGLVAVTSPASTIEPWAAVITGTIAGALLIGADKLIIKLKIDDPLSAIAVHMVNGLWGCVVPGLFASRRFVRGYYDRGYHINYGLFMGGGGNQLAVQVVGIVVILCWGLFWSAIVFFGLKFAGYLRVPEIDERMGLDIGLHGAHAYNELAVMSKAIAELAQSRREENGREVA